MITAAVFIVVAGVGVLLLSLADLLPIPWWWRNLLALLLTAVTLLLIDLNSSIPTLGLSGFDWAKFLTSSPMREFILFALLLIGMGARVVSLAIERRDASGATSTPMNIDRWQFVYPMLFAVPTFGALLSQLPTPNLSIADSVLAFQTGFFWQTILKKSEANVRV